MLINESLWVAVAFVLFFIIVWKKLSKNIFGILDDRKNQILSEINEAKELKDQAQFSLNENRKTYKKFKKT